MGITLTFIKKYYHIALATFALVLMSLYFMCTTVPETLKSLGYTSEKFITDKNGTEIKLKKAVIADACNSESKVCLKNVLLILGELNDATLSAIQELGGRTVTTVCFHSNGGSNETAKTLINIIKKYKLNTCLADEYYLDNGLKLSNTMCHSACPIIFLAGVERFNLGRNIKIGIHHSGQTFNLCIVCWRMNIGGGDFEDYIKGNADGEEHLALFRRSRLTPVSEIDLVSFEDWSKYKIFTKQQ